MNVVGDCIHRFLAAGDRDIAENIRLTQELTGCETFCVFQISAESMFEMSNRLFKLVAMTTVAIVDARGNIHTRKERLQRFLALDIVIQPFGNGMTVVQLNFTPKAEGLNYSACDSIISAMRNQITSLLEEHLIQN